MYRLFLPALLPLVLTACGPSSGNDKGAKGGPGAFPAAEVNAVTVTPVSIPVTFEYVGQTAGSREVEVRARVTGILQARNFAEGSVVSKGQSMFTIDPAPYEAALARADADVGAADARLEQAKRNAARLKPLLAEKAVSQKDLDDAVSAEQIGAADVRAAQARLTEAKLNLSYTRVEAPVTGISGRAQRSDGSLVSGPDVLLTTVTQVDPIWVTFGIPDNEQSRIQKEIEAKRIALPADGRFEVALQLADGSPYTRTGRLNFTDVRISTATGTREMRAELANPGGTLRPGQFVRVQLRGATRPKAIMVPQRAVLEGPQGKFVYLVSPQGQVELRPVTVGEWVGESWIITAGLQGGEQVITDGVMKIGPGAPVKVAEKPVAGKKPAAEKK